MMSWTPLIGVAVLLIALTGCLFYVIRTQVLQLSVVRTLRERGPMDLVGIIRTLKEMEVYPPRTPEFFVKAACEGAIEKGWIVRTGNTFIPRFAASDHGSKALDEYDWLRGKKKFPA